MNILDEIIARTNVRVQKQKELYPFKLLEQSVFYEASCVSLRKYLQRKDLHGIIAEYKRKSPSKGVLNNYASVEQTTLGYMQAGASALSILTEPEFFNGKSEDLNIARKFNYCPIIRKDFILDEYQVIEAKSIGADAVLLLANVLSVEQVLNFSNMAYSLGLEVILEVREVQDLDKLNENVNIVGVNNRNLKDFTENIDQSFRLADLIPHEYLKISESGISRAETILELKQAGYNGFLIGETFMRHSRPEQACANFIKSIDAISSITRQ
ncbi:MAG: indole-3-glycerol phosphate synthase TrpC [Bacteroidota bacterium]